MQLVSEMTGLEYRTSIHALAKSIGPKAEIWMAMNDDGKLFRSSLYSRGMMGDMDFQVYGDTFSELYGELTAKWTEYESKHRTATIRKMALAIIRITAELGHCTDAALRNCGEFDPEQVKAFGEQACADANEIAGRGPFTIVSIGGANAEAA